MGTYKVAPMDTVTRVVTIFYHLLTLGMLAYAVIEPDARPMLIAVAVLVVTAWFSWQIAPKSYEVTDDAVIIGRGWPFSDVRIPLQDIREVRPVKLNPWKTMRTFGVGGLYSASGRFRSPDVGAFYGAITDNSRTVYIAAASDNYVISPEDPEQFVADMQSRVGRSRL